MWVCLASEWLFLTESNWGKTAARCEAQQRGDERKKLMYFWHPWMHREPHCRRHYRFIPELFLFQLLNILKKPPVSCLFNIRFFVVFFFYSWSQEPCNDTVTFHANKQPSQRPSGLQLVYFPFSFPFFNVTYFWLASTNYSPQLNDCLNFRKATTCRFFTICLFFFDSTHADFLFIACGKVIDTVLFGLHSAYEAQL